MRMRWQPSLQVIPHYESNPIYINALINSIKNKIEKINWKPDLIISSYHGIPKKYFDRAIPIIAIVKNNKTMKEKFTLVDIRTTFQSRFGPQSG